MRDGGSIAMWLTPSVVPVDAAERYYETGVWRQGDAAAASTASTASTTATAASATAAAIAVRHQPRTGQNSFVENMPQSCRKILATILRQFLGNTETFLRQRVAATLSQTDDLAENLREESSSLRQLTTTYYYYYYYYYYCYLLLLITTTTTTTSFRLVSITILLLLLLLLVSGF